MEMFMSLILISVLGEAIVQTIKMIYTFKQQVIYKLLAIVVCEIIVFGAHADLFVLLNIPLSIPFAGYILTGILLSRGSAFTHDLLDKLIATRKKPKVIESKQDKPAN